MISSTQPPPQPKQGNILENKTFGKYKGMQLSSGAAQPGVLSCGQIYEQECEKVGCRVNNVVMEQLPKTPGVMNVRELNLGCNYIGEKGLLSVLPLIKCNLGMTKLRLSDNGLKNGPVLKLVKMLRDCPHVISLDLSSNKALSLEVGAQCLKLVKGNQDFMHLSLNKTGVSKQLQGGIEKVLADNRRKNGEKNKRSMESRLRIDKKQLFEAKILFDNLDKDKSGAVSLDEICAEISRTAPTADEAVFRRMDANKDGEITLIEYLHAAFPTTTRDDLYFFIDCYSEFVYPNYIPPPELSVAQLNEIKEIFCTYDTTEDGKLTLAELKAGVTKSALCVDVDKYFHEGDTSADGVLDLQEFIEIMKPYYMG